MKDDALPIEATARLRLGDLTVDLGRAQLEAAGGEPVDLRPQAFAVLRHLALNAGRLVTKDELFAAVWPGVVVTDDSLVQAIGDIRRALGAAGQRSVRTVPRRGYMLLADAAPGPTARPDTAEPLATGAAAQSPMQPLPVAAAPAPGSARSRRRLLAASAAVGCAMLASGGVWLWRSGIGPGSATAAPPALPTIAVLHFDSVSVDGKAGWIGDALRIGITSALVQLSALPVLATNIAHDPSRGSGAKAQAPLEVAATHVLSGSVQSDSRRVRVTVQLSQTPSGRVLWSEQSERSLDDLFVLEDDIIAKTVVALQIRLQEGEQARSRIHPRGNLKAWELGTRGYVRLQTGGPGPLADARQLFEQALALDPDYAWARSYLGATCFLESRFGFAPDPAASLRRAFDEAHRAVQTDPRLPDAHSTLGGVLLARREFDAAVAAGRRAVALGPNDAEIHAVLAQTLLAIGEWTEAVELSSKAIGLNARPPSWNFVPQCFSLVFLGRCAEAIASGERMLELAESPHPKTAALGAIAFAQVEGGQLNAARRTVEKMLPMRPGTGAASYAARLLFKDGRHAERLAQALRSAGLPG